jgi:hypothetical protein
VQILGDTNATLLDQTRIVEAELMEQDQQLYPLICSDVDSADEAYFKIPIQTKVDFPTAFDGEREDTSTEVNIVQQYNKATYSLTLDYNSDLMRESKSYSFSEKTQDGTISAKIFPNYNLMKNIITASGTKAYDNKNFFATNHLWANAGANTINNTVSKTGQSVTALYTDLQTAMAQMGTFLDDKGHLLNPRLAYGAGKILIYCPKALEINFRQLIFGSMIPLSAPVTTSGTAAVSATGPTGIGLNGIASLYADGYLDSISTTTWYLFYIGAPQKPFVFSQSYGIQTVALGFGSEFETNTGKVRIAIKHRFVEGTYRFDRAIKIS